MKINMKLFVKIVDFSSNFEVTEKLLWNKKFKTDMLLNAFIDKLNTVTMEFKSDWFDIDYEESFGNCLVRVNLVFTSPSLDNRDNEVVSVTSQKILELINELSVEFEGESNRKVNKESKGFYISFTENEGSGLVDVEDIEKQLFNKKVDYKRVSTTGKISECGASGFVGTVLIFVAGAVTSGITWDVIKKYFSNYFDDESVAIDVFEDFNYNMMLNEISNRTKIGMDELILTEMYKKDNEIIIQLKSESKSILVLVDEEYNIIELSVE